MEQYYTFKKLHYIIHNHLKNFSFVERIKKYISEYFTLVMSSIQ